MLVGQIGLNQIVALEHAEMAWKTFELPSVAPDADENAFPFSAVVLN